MFILPKFLTFSLSIIDIQAFTSLSLSPYWFHHRCIYSILHVTLTPWQMPNKSLLSVLLYLFYIYALLKYTCSCSSDKTLFGKHALTHINHARALLVVSRQLTSFIIPFIHVSPSP
jgi:hypothetical protein